MIQRYPFAPKAIWFKRYTDQMTLGKRKIYVATDTIGYEIKSLREFSRVELKNGMAVGEADYFSITERDGQVWKTTCALKLLDKIYIFNPDICELEEHDIIDEGMTVINALTSEIMVIERNAYLRKYAFDCIKETDQQDSSYQPISGLLTNSSYLTIKTHNFSEQKDEPQHEDILFYQGKYWIIEDTSKTYIYTPKEKSILHLSLKALK